MSAGPDDQSLRPCICLAMLVADKVIREQLTHKVYILGTFNSIIARQFPTVHDTMNVYLALTDASPGTHKARLEFVYIDEGPTLEERPLLRTGGPLAFKDKLQVVEFNMELRQVRFPKPGVVDIRFFLDDCAEQFGLLDHRFWAGTELLQETV